ncbi:MAG TPA: asparaginase [Patescibacteria group bacterium]|nr:asparaginase [Patescibacteria group bacterium]
MKNIVILATGGTIAGCASSSEETLSYTSGIISIDTLITQIPPLQKVANITGEQFAQIDSSDMSLDIWIKLAKRVNELLCQQSVDGIVITHGTDTLEETAYFLDLVVKSRKPVVLVGAMRPSTAISTDGPKNIYDGVVLAASDQAVGKGVLVCLNDTINCGRDVTKTNTSLQDTFKAPELGCLGYIQGSVPSFYRFPARKHTLETEFEINEHTKLPQVDILYAYADYNATLAHAAVEAGAKGLIHAGIGNGGMSKCMKETLVEFSRQGIVIVRSSRVMSGIVTRNGAVNDDECGFVAADSLNPQKARVLLMLALNKTSNIKEIQNMFWTY